MVGWLVGWLVECSNVQMFKCSNVFTIHLTLFPLQIFSKNLNKYGPKHALIRSTLSGSTFLVVIGISLHHLADYARIFGVDSKIISKSLVFALFVFQSANVQFLYTQHWSFLGSILSPEEGKVWFAPIAGIGSITSTLAAAHVSMLVERLGLIGLLCTAGLVIGSSAIFADAAYEVARQVRLFRCNKHGLQRINSQHILST